MKLGEKGFAIIRSYEKFRPTAYKPTPNDIWTIGFGHTRGVKEGDCCELHDGEDWLHADVAVAEKAVNSNVTVPLTQNQFDALVSLVFNIGAAAFSSSTLRHLLNAGVYDGAAAEFPKWRKQAGRVLAGLVARRKTERDLFETGSYVAEIQLRIL